MIDEVISCFAEAYCEMNVVSLKPTISVMVNVTQVARVTSATEIMKLTPALFSCFYTAEVLQKVQLQQSNGVTSRVMY